MNRLAIALLALLCVCGPVHADDTLVVVHSHEVGGAPRVNDPVVIVGANVTYNPKNWPTDFLGQAYWVVEGTDGSAQFRMTSDVVESICLTGDQLCKSTIDGGNIVRVQWTPGQGMVDVWVWTLADTGPTVVPTLAPTATATVHCTWLPLLMKGWRLPERSAR